MPEKPNVDAAEKYLVPGLERGLRLLSEFSHDEPQLSAAELARRLEVPRSTVFRLLVTLETLGYVERAGRDYQLGMGVLRLGFGYLASLDLAVLGQPLLDSLRDETSFACNMVMRDGRWVVYVAKSAARTPFASSVTVGTRLPAHATVFGRVLMQDLSLPALRRLYPEPRLKSHSARTPATVAALFDLLKQDQQRGTVMEEGFFEPNISTIAAPVRDQSGRVQAALGITVPASTLDDKQREDLLRRVSQAALELSGKLGRDVSGAGASLHSLQAK